MEHHLPYGIIDCYLPLETGERARFNASQKGLYLMYIPRRYGRLSWLKRLVTYWDGLAARRQSPIQVLTQPRVE